MRVRRDAERSTRDACAPPSLRARRVTGHVPPGARGRQRPSRSAGIVENPERKKKYQTARGKAGWRRVKWEGDVELIPGKTAPKFRVIKRDYTKILDKISMPEENPFVIQVRR